MEDLKKQVAELIRETRRTKGLTQKEIGEMLGISESTFNRYENGTANLSLETVEKVANILGVNPKILFE